MNIQDLTIRNWRYKDVKLLIAEIKLLLPTAITTKDKYGYQKLTRNQNKELFAKLTTLGFFDYHQTNNGHICYMHQIVLYLKSGWSHYKIGGFCHKDKQEVHHIDHDPTNNDESNLCYVSPYENKLLSQLVKGGFYVGRVLHQTLLTSRKAFQHIANLTHFRTLNRLALASHTF